MGLLIHVTMELERSGELSESFKATLNIRCKHFWLGKTVELFMPLIDI